MPRGRLWGTKTRRALVVVLTLFGAALTSSTPAIADGGTSIASAPIAPYGVQQFGNTATGAFYEDSCMFGFNNAYASFWGLNVMAGDELIVDWESVAKKTEVFLLPIGTTDYTLTQAAEVVEDDLPGTGKSQFTYHAPISGLMNMYFMSCGSLSDAGPYAFTAYVKHAVFTTLTPRVSIRPTTTLTGTAVMADGTPVPDGLAFTLSARWPGRGSAQFTATSAGGGLSFPVVLPPEAERRKVKFDISRGTDQALLATKSASMEVYVARAVPPASKPMRRHRQCRKGLKKRKVNGKTKCVRKHRR